MGAPFSLDPSATAAFAKLEQDVGAQALHDTAAPVKAVVLGGGTGAPVSIRTLLSLEADTSAVVAMADDGGSTGILREEAGVLPPGDIRKCLVAMAADEDDPLTRAVFRLREIIRWATSCFLLLRSRLAHFLRLSIFARGY